MARYQLCIIIIIINWEINQAMDPAGKRTYEITGPRDNIIVNS